QRQDSSTLPRRLASASAARHTEGRRRHGPPHIGAAQLAHAVMSTARLSSTRPSTMYLSVLTWSFTLFNSIRVLSYVPTMWAIHLSRDSSQHSLWTWLAWLGANATMAAWLYEHNGKQFDRAVTVNVGNAAMCLFTVLLIVAYRI